MPSMAWALLAFTAWGTDFHSKADASSTPRTVRLPIVVAVVIVAALALLDVAVAHRKEHGASRIAHRALAVAQATVALTAAAIAIRPIAGMIPTIVVVCVGVPLALIVMFAPAQAEERCADEPGDDFWRWGIFYVNREDENVLVPKRSGLGYTLNFAHPTAWLLLLVALLFPTVVIALGAFGRWLGFSVSRPSAPGRPSPPSSHTPPPPTRHHVP